uniref:DNA gyrase inhibitor YacG n=1 Tax=Rhodopseudomonas palustris (strain BisA53) TaxID=316055 RepID=Q07I34_RHOP5
MPAEPKQPAAARAKRCPICGKPAVEASRPFCSERCRDVDLNRWLSGSYAIPGAPEPDDDAD